MRARHAIHVEPGTQVLQCLSFLGGKWHRVHQAEAGEAGVQELEDARVVCGGQTGRGERLHGGDGGGTEVAGLQERGDWGLRGGLPGRLAEGRWDR